MHIDEQLFHQQIAFLKIKKIVEITIFSRISLTDKIAVIHQLLVLVRAGVLLPQALDIVAAQAPSTLLQEIFSAIADDVARGIPFHQSAATYPKVFDSMMIQLLHVGEETGSLPTVLHAIDTYLETRRDFYSRIRSALMMPAITFLFFIVISLVIFILIIPQFGHLFASLGHELPPLTQRMIAVSVLITSTDSVWFFCVLGLIIVSLRWALQTSRGKKIKDYCAVHAPLIGSIMVFRFVAQWLDALGLLLAGGMQLVPALQIVQQMVPNTLIHTQLVQVSEEVKAGSSLAQAMRIHAGTIFLPDVIAMIYVGEEVGSLSTMLRQAGAIYYDKLRRRLSVITNGLQPVLLIILALLIVLLIIAVYVPILNLSYAV
jgi:type IV pilus assembly protein PilC